MHSLKHISHISLHINQSLDWRIVRKLITNWADKFKINLSEKVLLYNLRDFYNCQKYCFPTELIRSLSSIGKTNINFWEEFADKSERTSMLFQHLNAKKGIALFIGPLNKELDNEWNMADKYKNINKILITEH
jgi:hypothetical protein